MIRMRLAGWIGGCGDALYGVGAGVEGEDGCSVTFRVEWNVKRRFGCRIVGVDRVAV